MTNRLTDGTLVLFKQKYYYKIKALLVRSLINIFLTYILWNKTKQIPQ